MKLTSFNCTIELSKDENGYSNNYYVDVTDKGVSISHPYVVQSQEQVMFVTNLIHDFIAASIAFNNRVDGFNRDNRLEQYALQAPLTEQSASKSTDVSAVPQSCALGGGKVSTRVEDALFDREEEMKENGEAVAYFTEELSKIIDARKKKD